MTATKRKPRGLSDGLILRGKIWYAVIRQKGRSVWVSSHSSVKADAEAIRNRLRVKRDEGGFNPDARHIMLADLQRLAEDKYAAKGNRSIKRLKLAWKQLRDENTGLPERALDVTTAAVTAYEGRRRDAGRARSSINYELAMLRFAWRAAIKARLLPADSLPVIETPDPKNRRTGAGPAEDLGKIAQHLPEWAAPIAEFLFLTGWRVSEALALTWRANVDQRRKLLRLEADETKGGSARTFPFGSLPVLETLLTRQRATPTPSDFVFHQDGRPVIYKKLRKAWRAACRKAKVAKFILHDLRRSAATNLVDAGVDRGAIKELCGWETDSMFARYHIVREDAKRLAVAKLAKALEPAAAE